MKKLCISSAEGAANYSTVNSVFCWNRCSTTYISEQKDGSPAHNYVHRNWVKWATRGGGVDPFEAVMCVVEAASQISECLWRMLFLVQNITCYLCRNLFEKIFAKRYTVWEIFIINLESNYFLARWEAVSKKKCVTLPVYKLFPRMWLLTGGR